MKRLLYALISIVLLSTILGFAGCALSTTPYEVSGSEQEIYLKIPGSGGVQIKMRFIPWGTFMMGSPVGETDRLYNEGLHKVTISKSFYIGTYEVTQAQWAAVMGTRPSYIGYNADYPVEHVSWDDCQGFIKKINTMGIGKFRLPTEAEWEYACRAWSTTMFPWGDDPGYTKLTDYAWYVVNSNETTHPVGQKKPNAWGLYDMHGNVSEWCSDWYVDVLDSSSQTNPKGPRSGYVHVTRGGDMNGGPQQCRSAYRHTRDSGSDGWFTFRGFRLVREL